MTIPRERVTEIKPGRGPIRVERQSGDQNVSGLPCPIVFHERETEILDRFHIGRIRLYGIRELIDRGAGVSTMNKLQTFGVQGPRGLPVPLWRKGQLADLVRVGLNERRPFTHAPQHLRDIP